jgi:hypothetical protein
VFLCMLAYYLEWHMRQRLAPMLFDDTDKAAAEAQRRNVVAQAQRSNAAVRRQTTVQTGDGLSFHSFRSLLDDLVTLAQHHRHRDYPELSAHRADPANADPAECLRPARGRDVASSAAVFQAFIDITQIFTFL